MEFHKIEKLIYGKGPHHSDTEASYRMEKDVHKLF